jgi:integrase/recombinase XerC
MAGSARGFDAADDDIARHLVHLEVERRLAPRTLSLYAQAFAKLQELAAAWPVTLREV